MDGDSPRVWPNLAEGPLLAPRLNGQKENQSLIELARGDFNREILYTRRDLTLAIFDLLIAVGFTQGKKSVNDSNQFTFGPLASLWSAP